MRSILGASLLVFYSIIGFHCSSNSGRPDNDDEALAHSGTPVLGVAEPFSLTDQEGRSVRSEDLIGKMWIATVTFTRSKSNSPQQTSIMRDLQDLVGRESLWHSVRLVSLTAEPEHDTPEVMHAYAAESGAEADHWHFLTGSRSDLADLIQSLGLPLLDEAREPPGPISMSPKFVLVDRHLNVRGIYDSFGNDPLQEITEDLRLILPEAPQLDDGTGRTHIVVPAENLGLSWIDRRRANQLEAASEAEVFDDFEFAHRLAESGITFRNKIVDDAGKHWIPNHYDHGNGTAVADVDGDGLLDLYFSSQVGGNELWRNRGDGTFANITQSAGIALSERIGASASFADIDNDGDPDLYVTTVQGGNALFENDGTGTFRDISATSGTNYVGHSSSAVFFDYDNDGLLDLFLVNVGVFTTANEIPVTNGTSPEQRGGRHAFHEGRPDAFAAHLDSGRAEPSVLYRNLGNGRFEDVTDEVGLVEESWSGDATPIDVNGDGWQDLYVLNMQGDDEYYENVEGRRFVRRSRDVFPQTPWGSMGVKSFDYNNDGRIDLFLTDMHSDMSEDVGPGHEKHKANMQWPDSLLAGRDNNIFGNAFFERERDGSFREISDQVGAENYWPWGLSVGDLNADGYEDVFIASSMNFPFRYGINSVLLNDRGRKFLDSEYVLGVEPREDDQTVTPWFELECDGPDREHEYCAGRDGDVVVWGAVGSRSSAIFDLDGDGDLDIVTNDFNSEPQVLVSNLSDRRDVRYLKVRLEGTKSNRDGLGAVVSLSADGTTQTRVMDGATGYLSHGVAPLYFGLNGAAAVDRIDVTWPSGATQVLDGPIQANQDLLIVEE